MWNLSTFKLKKKKATRHSRSWNSKLLLSSEEKSHWDFGGFSVVHTLFCIHSEWFQQLHFHPWCQSRWLNMLKLLQANSTTLMVPILCLSISVRGCGGGGGGGCHGGINPSAVNYRGQWRGWGWLGVEVSRDKKVQWETALRCPFMANHIPLSGFCPVMRMLLALLNNPITEHKGEPGMWPESTQAASLRLSSSLWMATTPHLLKDS